MIIKEIQHKMSIGAFVTEEEKEFIWNNCLTQSSNNSLGCGKMFKIHANKEIEVIKNCDFICGVANAWGTERFCKGCKQDLKAKWRKENLNIELKRRLKR